MPFIGQEPLVGGYHVLDNISASATNTYNLSLGGVAFTPESANHLLVSLNGVIQKPGSAFSVSESQITFIPSSGTLSNTDSIDFIVVLGNVLDVGIPSDNSISTAKIVDNAITQSKIVNEAINESKLQVSNTPTNGYFLSAQSGNTGGLTWAQAGGGKHSLVSSTTLSSNASSMTCTGITGDFDTYVFRLFGISTGDSLALRFNFTDDSGTLDTQSEYNTQILQFQSSMIQRHNAENISYAGAVNAADKFSVESVSSGHSGQIIEGFLGTPHTYDSGRPTGRMIHGEGRFPLLLSFTHDDLDANFGGICITGVPDSGSDTFAIGSYLQLWSVAKS